MIIEHPAHFLSLLHKIKNQSEQERIKKQIKKIIEHPEVGKPMRYARKGTREVHRGSYRLSYSYIQEEDKLVFLDMYHKDEQ